VQFNIIEKNIEVLIGSPIDTIRKFSPDEFRVHLEKNNKQKFSFTAEFPVIDRGNVLRDNIITSEEINKVLIKSLPAQNDRRRHLPVLQ
jgi:hypothetical protein